MAKRRSINNLVSFIAGVLYYDCMVHPECYISVDVEAAGPIPGTYSLLSIGACVVGNPDLASPKRYAKASAEVAEVIFIVLT